MIEDEYYTIKDTSEGLYKEKGSKFIARAIPVESEEEVRKKLEDIRKEYHTARHHCYAYQLGADKGIYRVNDDGEPSGTAGRPIYNQILSKNLTNILVVVIRYFGGTKLGASGLVNAYKTSTREALENAGIISRTVNDFYEVLFDYSETNNIMKIINEHDVRIISQDFDMKCHLTFSIRKRNSETIFKKIANNKNLKINYLRTE